ncbi:sensor histidine kinase NtrY-like [Sneathiella glossodoripedis]|uniref:sensor histidine kinase NtrY-like n=1 Tax=Sneathiella glossodoripedis TaxID=418853 RepID=UPI00131EEF00|nr:PAS domain-containing sensor histidine kinase [Sneathiella glossodoripedis]
MQTTQAKPATGTTAMRWARKIGLGPKSSFVVAMLSIAAGLATYGSLTGDDPRITRYLVIVDLVLLILLVTIVSQRLIRMWRRQKMGKAGSNMHRRVVRLFMLIAVAPALMVAIFSALFFNVYFQKHFSEPVNMAVSESLAVADSYIKEHIQNIRADILGMAADINRVPLRVLQDPDIFSRFLTEQVSARNLSEAIVIDGTKRIIAQSSLSFAVEFDQIPDELFAKARGSEVIILANEDTDRVRALLRIDRMLDGYLFVSRYIDPRVLEHMERTRKATRDYQQLREEGFGIQIQFAVIFIMISVMVVLAAVWFALAISSRLVSPIEGLVNAAERVRDGDLQAKVDERTAYDEMALLSRAFNRMTGELLSQREELEATNSQLDDRRRFTETVLSGVTAGVIGLNRDGIITLPNRTAGKLLDMEPADMIGKSLVEIAPQLQELLSSVVERPYKIAQSQIHLQTTEIQHHLLVRIAAQLSSNGVDGYVVTLDEITELVSAQRMAAWGDIARRIAHEIKNPLTPIQLAAERIKRKYAKQITSDMETFNKCTDTIIRQVGDIGQMVDEFSAFARMPAPEFRPEQVSTILEEAVFLQKVGNPDITYVIDDNLPASLCQIDTPQVTRVFTNLLQNAADSIHGREGDPEKLEPGVINVSIRETENQLIVEIVDNGRGLPEENRTRLTEPYVTHREKGTGLGLAIVNKIMEEHGGTLALMDADDGPGAKVQVSFYKIELKEAAGN